MDFMTRRIAIVVVRGDLKKETAYIVGSSDTGLDHAFLQLPFVASGIAIDNMRGRVYFSNYNGNSIAVYSTAGALATERL
jgi:hypothetical protein